MPKIAVNATPFDTHSHAFMQPNPQGSIDHGGVTDMPNACNQCHQGSGETAQWAAQTIAVAQARATPVAGAFFGPGPHLRRRRRQRRSRQSAHLQNMTSSKMACGYAGQSTLRLGLLWY